MLILGIDSSGHTASVALYADGVVLSEYACNIGLTHSQTLLPMVAEIFSRTGHTVEELDAIAVSAGPGSLEGLAMNLRDMDEVYVHPIMDARRSQVYTATFLDGQLIGEEEAIGIEDLVTKINQMPGKHFFLGDAVPVYRSCLEAQLSVPYRFAGPGNLLQRASSVAMLGAEQLAQGKAVSGKDFHLSYIRKPQAEREREAAGLREYDITHEDPTLLKKTAAEDRLTARNYKIDAGPGYEDDTVPENL